jgi:hypothetical protein
MATTKVALVTGASSGIGEATARELAAGFTVHAAARRAERMHKLTEAGIHPIAMDVTDDNLDAGRRRDHPQRAGPHRRPGQQGGLRLLRRPRRRAHGRGPRRCRLRQTLSTMPASQPANRPGSRRLDGRDPRPGRTPGTDSSNIHEPRWRTLASLRTLSSEAGKPMPTVAVILPTSTERTRSWLESDTVGLVLPLGFLVAGHHRPDIYA